MSDLGRIANGQGSVIPGPCVVPRCSVKRWLQGLCYRHWYQSERENVAYAAEAGVVRVVPARRAPIPTSGAATRREQSALGA